MGWGGGLDSGLVSLRVTEGLKLLVLRRMMGGGGVG